MTRGIRRPSRVRALNALVAAALAVAVSVALVPGGPPARAVDLAIPSPPSDVAAAVVGAGVRVTWTPAPAAAPAITRYVVHAGPGSCPVTVPATETSATLPVVAGQGSITPQVRAVNAYGFSTDAAAAPLDVSGRANPRYANVQLLEFSDFHGAIEASSTAIGAAMLVSAFESDRAAVRRTFTVSAGDNIGGSPVITSQFDELPSIQALNHMGLDVTTLGNHEHDQPLSHLRAMIDASEFDWVVSNYSSLVPLQTPTRDVDDVVLIRRGGVTLGFVGMNTADTSELVFPGNLSFGRLGRQELVISAEAATVNRAARQARRAGAEIVVALVHEGWTQNVSGVAQGELVDLANAFRGVDVVLGAHTHQTFASLVRGRPVTQVRNSGQEYARTQVCLDRSTGRVVGSNTEIVTKKLLPPLAEDPATAALVADYRAQLGPLLGERVGVVADVFPRGGTPPVERSGQTPFGDLAADAVRQRYGTDLVLLNGGGIRDTLPAAGFAPTDPSLRRPGPGSSGPYDVTLGDVIAVLPFGNNAATTTITGEALWRALENGVSGWPTEGRFPQISGFRFAFDPSRPVGSRIVSVTRADGTPIPRDATSYSVTTVDFMLYGGDGYTGVFDVVGAQIREPYVDAVVARLRQDLAAGVVTAVPAPDGRITRIG